MHASRRRAPLRHALAAAAAALALVAPAATASAGAGPERKPIGKTRPSVDRDRDRLPDRWERRYRLSTKRKSARLDPDRDRLRNRTEWRLRLHPRRRDTDRDGLTDGWEVRRYRTDPRRRDTDGDGLADGTEVRQGADPRRPAPAPFQAPVSPVFPPAPGSAPLPTTRPKPPAPEEEPDPETADTEGPQVSLTAPAAGTTLSGTVSWRAGASDPSGIDRVEFLVDGAVKATDREAPYEGTWDTTTASAGSHTVKARGVDALGNTASASAGVSVSNGGAFSYSTTWLGNTFAGGDFGDRSNKFVQHSLSGAWVATDGSVVTNTNWDEGYRKSQIYKDGQVVTHMESLNPRINIGGAGVVADATYVYQAVYHNGWGVARFFRSNGSPAPFAGGGGGGHQKTVTSGGFIEGLALVGDELYISARDNVMRVYDKNSLTLTRSFNTDPQVGKIAADGSGVYAIHGLDYIKKYSPTGSPLGTITDIGRPTALAIENHGSARLMAFDDEGSSQQIKYFNRSSLSTDGAPFGTPGGMMAAPKGKPGPTRFLGVMGLGTDSSGNVYVAMNVVSTDLKVEPANSTEPWNNGEAQAGGTVIRSVSPSGDLRWELLGLAHVDSSVFDPADENVVYTPRDRFRLDLSKPVGRQWTWEAHTIDRFSYPTDGRRRASSPYNAASPIVFTAGGRKFMGVTNMHGGWLQLFRESGDVFAPAGSISFNRWALDIDSAGTIWTASGGNIEKRTFKEVDASGNPVWNAVTTTPKPADFTQVMRIHYEPATDVMYLFGYTPALPDNTNGCSFGMVGRSAARYDNWSTSRTKQWQVGLKEDVVCNQDGPDQVRAAKTVSVAGDYIFTADLARAIGTESPAIRIYSALTGAYLKTIAPGPEVKNWMGLVDIPYASDAQVRSNGEYNLLLEEDGTHKQLLFRLSNLNAL